MEILSGLLAHLGEMLKNAVPPTVELLDGRVNAVLRRDGWSPIAVDLRRPRKQHTLTEIGSFCAYLKRYGEPESTTVFCDGNRFIAVLKDAIGLTSADFDASGDWIEFKPESTTAFIEWKRAFEKATYSHVDFRHLLEDRMEHVAQRGFIAAVKGFSASTSVEYDADLTASNDNIVVRTSTKKGAATSSGVVELDREFSLNIPLVIGWPKTYEVKVRVEVDISNGVRFKIAPKNLTEVQSEIVNDLVEHITEEMGEGWLVVRGVPALTPRVNGSAAVVITPTNQPFHPHR